MEYLWVWADAVVFRSWDENAVKFYLLTLFFVLCLPGQQV